MADPKILIVGAGPTGMTAAIELKRAGMYVRIIDKSDRLARFSPGAGGAGANAGAVPEIWTCRGSDQARKKAERGEVFQRRKTDR